ncbi:MAG: hypothetical protein FWD57_06035 [Polyangiaceae bacterium]|nr:hypothetical protein [Polyangiaceae bacterium]
MAQCLKAVVLDVISRIAAHCDVDDSEESVDVAVGWQIIADHLYITRKANTK